MARAETLESAGAGGGGRVAEGERGGPGPLVRPSTCRMELPQPSNPSSGLLTATSTSSCTLHLQHHHNLPLQALFPHYPQRHHLPDGSGEPQRQQQSPQSSPPCSLTEEAGNRPGAEARGSSGGRSGEEVAGYECEDQQEASSGHGPLLERQPQNEHPSWASARRGILAEVAMEEVAIMRVAHELRAIGDQINTSVLHRAQVAPQWRDWRSACLELLNFVTQTLNTLSRHT